MPGRAAPLQQGQPLRRTRITATVAAARRPRRDTGPARSVRQIVYERSGGWCEWPGCTQQRAEVHHRLGRKAGGRHGSMSDLINQAAWLLAACREHHWQVTSPVGAVREQACADGWLLVEGQDARSVPVLTRHWPGPILLDDEGCWSMP